MPDWAIQFIQTFGVATFVIVLMALAIYMIVHAVTRSINSGTKKEEAVTSFAVSFNDERRQWQERHETDRKQWEERHDKLQGEFTNFRIAQAEKEGGLKILQDLLTTERAERREFERMVHDDNRKLEARVDVLEKDKQAGLERIRELETEREDKNRIIAEKDARIGVLETKVEELTNKSNTLSELVERLQNVPVAVTPITNTQPLPLLEDIDDTLVPEVVSAVTVAAEEQKS